MKKLKYPKIELLNFEGPVLTAIRQVNLYVIQDQWKEVVGVWLDSDMQAFLEGKMTVEDTHGKVWNYANEHEDAKPNREKLDNFLYKMN